MADYLRRWRRDDAHALAAVYAQADADLLNNIPENRSPAGALAWIEGIRAAENEGSAVAFAIVRGDCDEESVAAPVILGNVMAAAIEHRHSTAWISYWLTPSARGQGLAAAGLRSLVDHLHDETEVYRLELGYRVNNPSSAAVASAAGFLVEGRERQRLLYNGVRFDTEVCARLSSDPRAPGHRLSVLMSL